MMGLEHHTQPMLPRRMFIRRMLRFSLVAGGILLAALAIGLLGYRYLEGMAWIDALLNAAMILGGMGPVDPLQTAAGKLFASFYALFSGVVFLVIAGTLLTPVAHRLMHVLHLETEEEG